TRARGKFINIVDKKYISSRTSKNKTVQQLIYHLEKSGQSYTRHAFSQIVDKKSHPNLQWYEENILEPLLQDIEHAKKITISATNPAKLNQHIWQALKRLENKVDIQFITLNNAEIQLQKYGLIQKDVVMPFIQINEEILWVGTPQVESNYESSTKQPFFKCRLVSKQTIEIFTSFLNLKEAKLITNKESKQIVSFRPSYTFTQYVTSWDQCPSCKSVRRISTKHDGSYILNCDYCGMKAGLQDWYVQKYFDYADVKCSTCNSPLEVEGKGKDLTISCSGCRTEIEVQALL
ncbi:phospholipase D-like domain-containing protein, partial [Pallidibacillus pasinlerensis]|nr:hypothetical protein [Pallidibacillus pasinlerensis]